MLELKTKTITTYGLLINGEFIPFSTKKLAIEIGREAYKCDNSVKLIKKYNIFSLSLNDSKLIDEQEFDRLISTF